jgi:hypothetical protein
VLLAIYYSMPPDVLERNRNRLAPWRIAGGTGSPLNPADSAGLVPHLSSAAPFPAGTLCCALREIIDQRLLYLRQGLEMWDEFPSPSPTGWRKDRTPSISKRSAIGMRPGSSAPKSWSLLGLGSLEIRQISQFPVTVGELLGRNAQLMHHRKLKFRRAAFPWVLDDALGKRPLAVPREAVEFDPSESHP